MRGLKFVVRRLPSDFERAAVPYSAADAQPGDDKDGPSHALTLAVSRLSSGTNRSITAAAAKPATTKIM